MGYQPVLNVAELKLVFGHSGHSKISNCTWYFEKVGGWSQAQVQSLADEARARFITVGLPARMPTEASVTEFHARDLTVEFGAVATASGAAVAGTNVGEMSSPNNAALVRFFALSGPPRQGGVFWPYVIEGNVSEIGLLDPAFTAALEGEIQSWCEGLEVANGLNHVIVSRYTRKVPGPGSVLRTPNALYAQVTSYQTRRRVASQRDRRPALPGN